MSFTKSIDILYNKFFDKNNFKDINLPFIDGTQNLITKCINGIKQCVGDK